MKTLKIALALSLILGLVGCKAVANVISPPPEDISAVIAACEKQKEAIDLALELHKKSMQQMHDMGIDEAYGRIRQAALDETHKATAPDGSIQASEVERIAKESANERARSKEAWDRALLAGFEPQVWADLQMVSDTLKLFILTRMGAEEQKNALMIQAHDLVKKKKE